MQVTNVHKKISEFSMKTSKYMNENKLIKLSDTMYDEIRKFMRLIWE